MALDRLIDHWLARRGLVAVKTDREPDSRMVTPRLRDALIADIAGHITAWLAATGRSAEGVANDITAFFDLWPDRPVRDNRGGSGVNDSLALFVIARRLAPSLVIESGTWRGLSAWLLRRACPEAEIITCDIDHGPLAHRDPGVRYHLGDWTAVAPARLPADALLFLDDHVSHARRLAEAVDRGATTVLLDDDVPARFLHSTGVPPAPTAAMLMADDLEAGETLEWLRGGRPRQVTVTAADLAVRDRIAAWHPFPDLSPVTGWRRQTGLSLVRLHPGALS